MTTTATTYTLNDAGVYVDYGYQNADETCERVIGIAKDHGFKPKPYDTFLVLDLNVSDSSDGVGNEWISEVADEATDYMNDHYPVDGAYWTFDGDAGGWGLFVETDE